MAHRDQLCRPLGRLDASDAGSPENVPLGDRIAGDLGGRGRGHHHLAACERSSVSRLLGCDVHHSRPAERVEVRQSFGHPESVGASPLATMLGTRTRRVPTRCLSYSERHRPAGGIGRQRKDEGVRMPTYEYACSKCGDHLEAVQSFKRRSPDEVPRVRWAPEEGVRQRRDRLQGFGLLQDRQPQRIEARKGHGRLREGATSESGSILGLGPRSTSDSDSSSKAGDTGQRKKSATKDPAPRRNRAAPSQRPCGRILIDQAEPLSDIPSIATVCAAATPGSHSTSPPMTTRESSIRCKVDAMVTSLTGSASSPPLIIRPSTPTEKSPLTEFTPECTPVTDWTNRPSPTAARTPAWSSVARGDRHGTASRMWASSRTRPAPRYLWTTHPPDVPSSCRRRTR